MGSIFTVFLCLITAFSLVSCAVQSRSVVKVDTVVRSPEGEFKIINNKEYNRRYVSGKF